jgi:hypothetical protein
MKTNNLMEQQLINAFMKLIAKAGGGSLIKDLIQQVDENGNPKVWTASEIEKAVTYVYWQTENFGAAEATIMVETLLKKYSLRAERFLSEPAAVSEEPKIQGLQ